MIQCNFVNVTTFSSNDILFGWNATDRQATYVVLPHDTSDMILYHHVRKYGSLSHDLVFLLVDMARLDLSDVSSVLTQTTFLDNTKQDYKRIIAIMDAHRMATHGVLLATYRLQDLRQNNHREVAVSDLYNIINIHNSHDVYAHIPENVQYLAPVV